MKTNINFKKDATIIHFNEYTVHYYSQSSNPWEAAYINCFQKDGKEEIVQVGYIIFTYPNGTNLPGQEPPTSVNILTSTPLDQVNHLEPERGRDFFVIYYSLERFDDVINQLRFAFKQNKSVFASCDPLNHIWDIGNNLHLEVGNQY